MSVSNLESILQEWHALTLAETAALRAHDWPSVAACQQSKLAMQHSLDHQLNGVPADERIRRLVEQLIAMEADNSQWLTGQLDQVRSRRSELDRSRCKLRRIRSSYGSRAEAQWESYS